MKDAYQKLSQEYTDEEIAESFVLPSNLTEEEQKKMQDVMSDLRKKQRAAMTEQEKMYSALMQLKYQMIDAAEREYDVKNDFSKYLFCYMKIVERTQKDMAGDIGMTTNDLSEILANTKEPERGMFFRLESHSGSLIPALLWWKLAINKQEHEITKDEQRKKREYAKVKNNIYVPIAK